MGVVGSNGSSTERRLSGLDERDGAPTGLREVFHSLEESRRVCRHSFNAGSKEFAVCEGEFECVGCHRNHKAVERMSLFTIASSKEGTGMFHHRGHTRARIELDGLVRVGTDRLSSLFLMRARQVLLPQLGRFVTQGELAFGFITGEGNFVPVLSPISGQVIRVNDLLEKGESERVSAEPPWVFVVRPFDLTSEVRPLLFGPQADKWLRHEDEWLRGLLYGHHATAADGGKLYLPENIEVPWKRLKTEFFISG